MLLHTWQFELEEHYRQPLIHAWHVGALKYEVAHVSQLLFVVEHVWHWDWQLLQVTPVRNVPG